jgi:hypothetical protein
VGTCTAPQRSEFPAANSPIARLHEKLFFGDLGQIVLL